MVDRVQAAIVALRGALDVLDRSAILRRAAANIGHDGHVRHAERVVALCGTCTEASAAPAAVLGMGDCTIRHPIHAPRAALFGLLSTFGALPATVEVAAAAAELRRGHAALDAIGAGRA